MEKFSFETAQEFFKSWGLYPTDEDTDDYNKHAIDQGINRACYHKLTEEAGRMYGKEFASLCARVINAQDDMFYLRAYTWKQLEQAWERIQS